MFRPGLMENIPAYLERVNSSNTDSDSELTMDILRETYGILVYKEQCMQLVNAMTDIPLSKLSSISLIFLPRMQNDYKILKMYIF